MRFQRITGASYMISALCIMTLQPHPAAHAMDALVLGDSIGEGLATTIGLKSIARRSFSLRRGDVGAQVKQIPSNAVGLLSLGLNDAADPVEHLSKSIEKVVDTAVASGRPVVWIGPPCVTKAWDKRAEALDAYLKQRLAPTSIQYVSLRDPNICAPKLRTRDGEHFTVEGYKYVWDKIKREAPLAATLEPDACERLKSQSIAKGSKSVVDCAKLGNSADVRGATSAPK